MNIEPQLFVPRPWQPPMIDHIAEHRRCALFARMGAGKTGAVLTALSAVEALDEAPVLIIGPKRVARKTWPSETAKWTQTAHLDVSPIVGTLTERFQALGKDRAFYSINYEHIPWLVEHFGRNWPFKTIVADELTRLKGHRLKGGGRRAASLARVAHRYCDRFIGLTGTPSPNGLKDLWGQLWFIDQGQRLGRTHEAFRDRWFRPSLSGFGVDPFDFAQQQIQDAISDVCLTIDPADYIKVDSVIETDVPVYLPAKARRHYREMEQQMYTELEADFSVHEIEAVNAGVRTQKCLQLAGGAVYTDEFSKEFETLHTAKIEALESIIEEACGAPVLVSYQFRHELHRILKHFPQARYFDDDPQTEDAWNRGEIPIMVSHPASAGHGSNLQYGGNILVDFGSGWDAEGDDQIIERIGPMRQMQSGLNRPVYRYRLMAENTVDYLVKQRRDTKRSVQSILLEALKRR